MKRALLLVAALSLTTGCATDSILYSIFGRPNGMEAHEFRDQMERHRDM